MPCTRRSLLAALPTVAGLSAVAPNLVSGAPESADPLGVRADFPAAETSLYLNSAYITPTPLPFVS